MSSFIPRPITKEQAAEGYNNEGRGKLVGYVSDAEKHEETCQYRMSNQRGCNCRAGLWRDEPIDVVTAMAPATAAKYDKPAVFQGVLMRFPRAMKEVARVSMFGTKKHNVPLTDMSYMDIPDAYNVYRDAEARHIVNEAIEGYVNLDPADGGMLHAAQRAWDALAQLEILLRDREAKKA